MPLEIDGREGERSGYREPGLFQALALPALRRRVIDLEHADTLAGIGIAQRKCIEAGPEHDHLAHAAGDTGRQRMLGKSAARSDEQAPRPQRRIGGCFVQPGAGLVIENPCGTFNVVHNRYFVLPASVVRTTT